MNSIQESIATAMECDDVELVDYLPYILQDFTELGSSAASLTSIVKDNNNNDTARILDLGCGKGAVLREMARQVKSICLGIDGIKEFIEHAGAEARKRGLTQCRFQVGDIRNIGDIKGKFDFIILGSIGPVFGDYYTTMETLKPILDDDGIIVLDDGYIKEGIAFTHALIGTKGALIEQITRAGMEILKEYPGDEIRNKGEYEKQLQDITKRCHELMVAHPDKKELFKNYLQKQEKEYRNLEEAITSSTMLIKRKRA